MGFFLLFAEAADKARKRRRGIVALYLSDQAVAGFIFADESPALVNRRIGRIGYGVALGLVSLHSWVPFIFAG